MTKINNVDTPKVFRTNNLGTLGKGVGAGLGIGYVLRNSEEVFTKQIASNAKLADKALGVAKGAGKSALIIGGLALAGEVVGGYLNKVVKNDKEENKKLFSKTVKTILALGTATVGTIAAAVTLKKSGKLEANNEGKRVVEFAKKGLSKVADKTVESNIFKKAEPVINKALEKVVPLKAKVSEKLPVIKEKTVETIKSVKEKFVKQPAQINPEAL